MENRRDSWQDSTPRASLPLPHGLRLAVSHLTMKWRLDLVVSCMISLETTAFAPGGAFCGGLSRYGMPSFLANPHRNDCRIQRRGVGSVDMLSDSTVAVEQDAVEAKKKVVVIGAGWAGLAAAHELSKQVLHCICTGLNFMHHVCP